jgi:hypothetical protein
MRSCWRNSGRPCPDRGGDKCRNRACHEEARKIYLIERTLRSWVVRTLWILLLCKVVLLALTLPVAAQNRPDWTEYNVPFPSPPQDGAGANKSFFQGANRSDRISRVRLGKQMSCQRWSTGPTTRRIFDNAQYVILAKLQWLKLVILGAMAVYNVAGDFYSSMFPSERQFEQQMMTTFGDACSGVTEDAHISTPMPPFLRVHSVISGSRLRAEINYVLNYVHELDAFPGTDGAACGMIGTQKGDWDVRMKSLMRMLFLDSRQTPNPSVLPNYLRPDRATRDYILQDLITVDGGPDATLTTCGLRRQREGHRHRPRPGR